MCFKKHKMIGEIKMKNQESIDCASVSSSKIKSSLKIAIQRKAFLSASEHLVMLDKSMEANSVQVYDSSLLKVALERIVYGTELNFENTNVFLTTKIDKSICDLYDLLIQSFKNKDYEKCLEIIEKIKKLFPELADDFSMLNIAIVENMRIKQEFCESKLNYLYEQLKVTLQSNDKQKVLELVRDIQALDDEPKESIYYNALYSLIIIGCYEEVAVIMHSIKITNQNKELIRILKRAIDEYKTFSSLGQEGQSVYLEAKSVGKMNFHDGKYMEAYDTFRNAFLRTNLIIFKYYLGKVTFSMGQYDKAEEYLLEYVQSGSTKVSKAYVLLAEIEKCRQNDRSKYWRKANQYFPLYTKTMLNGSPDNFGTLQLRLGTNVQKNSD